MRGVPEDDLDDSAVNHVGVLQHESFLNALAVATKSTVTQYASHSQSVGPATLAALGPYGRSLSSWAQYIRTYCPQ
jgi:hypothetical protein